MQTRLLVPPLKPMLCKMASVCLIALFSCIFSVSANAQTDEDGLPVKCGYNKDVRTGTWSIHAQGGLSWATGVWYENVNAKKSYGFSTAAGGGFDYTFRPWVRAGVEYLWGSYRREQRITEWDKSVMPIKAYGTYHVNAHNIKASAGFNVMEIWPNRDASWVNLWAGTGLGYMMANDYEYGCYFSTILTQNGVSKPVTGEIDVNNSSSISIQGNVRTENRITSFNSFYIPLSLHLEFDITRQFSAGVKGEANLMLGGRESAPKSMVYGMATLRYNFVQGKAKKMKHHFDNRYAALEAEFKEALRKAEMEKARADKAEAEKELLAAENIQLTKNLNACEESKSNMVAVKPEYTVFFENNKSIVTNEYTEALKSFVQAHKGKKFSLLAEASVSGSKMLNQRLSERRLDKVIKALLEMGVSPEDIKPGIAIGSQRRIDSAQARRVTITAE